MTLRESRGVFELSQPLKPQWQPAPLPSALKVVALETGGGDLRVLAHGGVHRQRSPAFLERLRRALWPWGSPPSEPPEEPDPNTVPVVGYRADGPQDVDSYVLRRRPDGAWTTEGHFPERLGSLALLHDGTLAAGGDGLLGLRSPAGEWTIREAPARLTCVWGAGAGCVHALGQTVRGRGTLGKTGFEATWVSCGLFYFDGAAWTEIDLPARDIRGFFVAGACGRDGYGWIVGTYGTHSCMARGRGTDWERDGCGSWYLYHVHVGADGTAFALGGDGLWRHHADGGWRAVEAFGDSIGAPLALGTVQGKPWVIDARSLGAWAEGRATAVGLFMGGPWVTLVPPEGSLAQDDRPLFAISETGEAVVARGSEVWQSPPLGGLLQGVWPPKRLTPADDPQLGSSEPLVRAWSELRGSEQLGQWCWWRDGIVGALRQGKRSTLVRWHLLSEAPQTTAELDFEPGQVAVAPDGSVVGMVPNELDERGVYQAPRRVVLVDLVTGEAREMVLPQDYEYDRFSPRLMWSPDGSRFLIAPRRRRVPPERRELLVFRAPDLVLDRSLPIAAEASPIRWEANGIVVRYGPLSAVEDLKGASAAWLDPASGERRPFVDWQNVSPSGKYRVTLRGTTIVVTSMADATVRELVPTPGGLLDRIDGAAVLRMGGIRWAGERLEITARLVGPVHLDLDRLTLRYALPPREEGEPLAKWSSDGRFALRPGFSGVVAEGRQRAAWAWGVVEA